MNKNTYEDKENYIIWFIDSHSLIMLLCSTVIWLTMTFIGFNEPRPIVYWYNYNNLFNLFLGLGPLIGLSILLTIKISKYLNKRLYEMIVSFIFFQFYNVPMFLIGNRKGKDKWKQK